MRQNWSVRAKPRLCTGHRRKEHRKPDCNGSVRSHDAPLFLDLDQEAEAVENAVQKILKDGYRTVDIMSEGCKKVSTSEMGDLLVKALA